MLLSRIRKDFTEPDFSLVLLKQVYFQALSYNFAIGIDLMRCLEGYYTFISLGTSAQS